MYLPSVPIYSKLRYQKKANNNTNLTNKEDICATHFVICLNGKYLLPLNIIADGSKLDVFKN